MSIFEYVNINWALLLIVIAMLLLIRINVFVSFSMRRKLYALIFLNILFSVFEYVERWLGNQEKFSVWRSILTAFKYSMSPWIILLTISVVFGIKNFLDFLPAILNTLLCFISIPTKIVFWFNDENQFQRGVLNFVPFFSALLYVIFFFIKHRWSREKKKKEERLVIYFMVLSAAFMLLSPVIPKMIFSDEWYCVTIAIDIFTYYVFVCQQLTQRDALTGLLNRQSYYTELIESANNITAVVSIDMNGLKDLNDSKGHEAGDIALTAIGDCMSRNLSDGEYAYRVGGDEFILICVKKTEEEVKRLVDSIKLDLAKTKYTCSFGCSFKEEGKSVDDMIRESDEIMYANKEEYYKSKRGL